jgi:hypothetical protein
MVIATSAESICLDEATSKANLRPARWPHTTLYKAQVVLDSLLTPNNDVWARGASRGWNLKPFQRVGGRRWLLIMGIRIHISLRTREPSQSNLSNKSCRDLFRAATSRYRGRLDQTCREFKQNHQYQSIQIQTYDGTSLPQPSSCVTGKTELP